MQYANEMTVSPRALVEISKTAEARTNIQYQHVMSKASDKFYPNTRSQAPTAFENQITLAISTLRATVVKTQVM